MAPRKSIDEVLYGNTSGDEPTPPKKPFITMKWKIYLIGGFIAFLFGISLVKGFVQIIPAGYYQVKQSLIDGELTAKMTPGPHWLMFGTPLRFPVAETLYLTSDQHEGKAENQSVNVMFADGSKCGISATARVIMPNSETDAVSLVKVDGFRTYEDVENKMVLQTIRNVLMLTANMMTAKESYQERKTDFLFYVQDQLDNGLYETELRPRVIKDPVTGDNVTKEFRIIKLDEKKLPKHQSNALTSGVRVKNFAVKDFDYDKIVKEQIQKQQDAQMGMSTAQALARKAEQEKLQKIAEGEKAVAEARYDKEKEKIRAVTDAAKDKEVQELAAQRDKNVAEMGAQRDKNVALLARDAAEFTKQKSILLGQGEAEASRLKLQSNNMLELRLEALKAMNKDWANAYANRAVPHWYISGGGDGKNNLDKEAFDVQTMMSVYLAKLVDVDPSIKNK